MDWSDLFIVIIVVMAGIIVQDLLLTAKWLMPISTPASKPPQKNNNEPKECKLHDWVNCPKHEPNSKDAHLVCTKCGLVPQ